MPKDAIGNAIKFEIPPQPAALAAAVGPVTQIGNNCVYMSVYIYIVYNCVYSWANQSNNGECTVDAFLEGAERCCTQLELCGGAN